MLCIVLQALGLGYQLLYPNPIALVINDEGEVILKETIRDDSEEFVEVCGLGYISVSVFPRF